MDLNLYLFMPVSGAIIGCFTNWIAIKMLFRPHEEKRIFGLRVPFTPGLMPKERLRLASKIGETIGGHILTDAVIMETVDKNKKVIEDYIDKFIEGLKSDSLTPADIAVKLFSLGNKSEIEGMVNYLRDLLVKTLKSPDVSEKITEALSDTIIKLLKSENAGELAVNLIKNLKPELLSRLREYFQKGAIEELIVKSTGDIFEKLKSDERILSEIIPEKVVEIIKKAINDRLPDLADVIKNLPYENPAVDTALRELLNKLIDDNIGSIASMFINKDKLYSNMRFGMLEYLSDKDKLALISEKTGEIIDKLLSSNAAHYISKLPENAGEQLSAGIVKFMTENISHEYIEKTLLNACDGAAEFLTEKSLGLQNSEDFLQGGTVFEMTKKFAPGFEESLRGFVSTRVSSYLEANARTMVNFAFTAAVDYIGGFRIDKFVSGIKHENMLKIKSTITGIICFLIDKAVKAVLENVDISKIAEEQINKFDMMTAENIIISVVNRELKAITYFGGLLGFIIGLLPALMNALGL